MLRAVGVMLYFQLESQKKAASQAIPIVNEGGRVPC